MAKIMLHLADNNSVSDFVALRHRILIALTVQCPLIVSLLFSILVLKKVVVISHCHKSFFYAILLIKSVGKALDNPMSNLYFPLR